MLRDFDLTVVILFQRINFQIFNFVCNTCFFLIIVYGVEKACPEKIALNNRYPVETLRVLDVETTPCNGWVRPADLANKIY